MLDTRVTCLKFKDGDSGGDLDLIMYTGQQPPYYNSASFNRFVDAFADGDDGLKTWIMEDPIKYDVTFIGACTQYFRWMNIKL